MNKSKNAKSELKWKYKIQIVARSKYNWFRRQNKNENTK